MTIIRSVVVSLICLFSVCQSFAATKIEIIRSNKTIRCGVGETAGFSIPDNNGRWVGFEVDMCRAIATAILGDPEKVSYVPLTPVNRFVALQSGEIDVLTSGTTWTYSRDTEMGIVFTATIYFDGQGIMVPKKLRVKSLKELDGATVCVQPGTTTELNLATYARANNIKFKPVVFEKLQENISAFFGGRCDAFTSDSTQLVSVRINNAPKGTSDDYEILPELISKEPLSIAVASIADRQFENIVRWTIHGLQQAEELGITKEIAKKILANQVSDPAIKQLLSNPDIARLLGRAAGIGKGVGLSDQWLLQAIAATGNYGEIWNSNLAPLKIPRGQNNLWNKGGLIYPIPFR